MFPSPRQSELRYLRIVWSRLLLAALIFAHGPAEARAPSVAHHEMVAAANPYAAEAGLAILKQGGGAVDAAIAVQLVLGLVEPQSSGIGGGAFLLYYAPVENGAPILTTVDGRETAPAGVTPLLFAGTPRTFEGYLEAVAGGRSVGTPGVVAMLALAHERYGRLPWGDLFAPAIRLAEDGFIVSPRLQYLADSDPLLRDFPAAKGYLFDQAGKALSAGTPLKNLAYAATLRAIQRHGPQAFYKGRIAKHMVRAVKHAPRHPGVLSLDDLNAYQALERAPLCGVYRDRKICGMGPPSSGGSTVLAILKLLERFDLAAEQPMSPRALHLIAEASRLAYADRDRYVADPDKVMVPTAGLVDAQYLKARSALIDPARAMTTVTPGTPPGAPPRGTGTTPEVPSTSHFVVVDQRGAVVSMTTSVESAFGSRLFVDGFFLNNQLTDFAFEPMENGAPVANRVEPGKRPRSSMSPTIAFDRDGQFELAVGSPGGNAIIGFVAKTLIGVLDWGLDIQAAIELPNFIAAGEPLTLEEGAPADLAPALRALGHIVTTRRIASGLHGVMAVGEGSDRHLQGGADPRREGVAIGE